MKRSVDNEWRHRCEVALREFDPVKTLERIAEARSAVLDGIEDNFAISKGEHSALREALSALDALHLITEHQIVITRRLAE